jgi:hypothetical protein
MHSFKQRICIAVVLLMGSAPAFAYIDPGTGSALIQGLIAGIAAVSIAAKLYWHRIVKFFSRKEKLDEPSESGTEKEQ